MNGSVRVSAQLKPWALVYVRLMARMPGGDRARDAVAQFIIERGLEMRIGEPK